MYGLRLEKENQCCITPQLWGESLQLVNVQMREYADVQIGGYRLRSTSIDQSQNLRFDLTHSCTASWVSISLGILSWISFSILLPVFEKR